MIRRPPRSTRVRSSAASDVYKRQVSIPSVASEPSSPRHYGDQNSALCANITSVRRATDWNHSSRVLGPYAVLDSCRPGIEAIGVQGLLQSTSHSRQSRRQNTGRSSWCQCVRDVEAISMERTLSRIISDAHGGIITNSPCTRAPSGWSTDKLEGASAIYCW